MPAWQRRPRLRCIVPVSSACSYMAASHGPLMLETRRNWTPSISGADAISLTYHWAIKSQNIDVLTRSGLSSMYALLQQRRLRWLGHVCRMDDGRIPKDIMYGENYKRTTGASQAKRDMKTLGINTESWKKDDAASRAKWKSTINQYLAAGEEKLRADALDKRTRRKQSTSTEIVPTIHKCNLCDRDCHSRIGLYSHRRQCIGKNNCQDDISIVNTDWRRPTTTIWRKCMICIQIFMIEIVRLVFRSRSKCDRM